MRLGISAYRLTTRTTIICSDFITFYNEYFFAHGVTRCTHFFLCSEYENPFQASGALDVPGNIEESENIYILVHIPGFDVTWNNS